MVFRVLESKELPKLIPFLESKFPSSAMMLNFIKMTISGKYPSEDGVEIYGYNGIPVNSKYMFIVVILKPHFQDSFVLIYSPQSISKQMKSSFCDLFDWSKPHEFGAVMMPFATDLEKIISGKGKMLKNPAADMYLPKEDALRLNLIRKDLEEEFELDELSPEHAKTVNFHWKFGGDKGEVSIAAAISAFGAAGVFKKRDSKATRTNEDLVSWIVFLRLGTLNALHTLDEYRRRGLAQWTMEAACKKLAQEGLTPLCEIEFYNDKSRSLVEKIGFKLVHDVYWMHYKPGD